MEIAVGFEPTTKRLRASYSTTELRDLSDLSERHPMSPKFFGNGGVGGNRTRLLGFGDHAPLRGYP